MLNEEAEFTKLYYMYRFIILPLTPRPRVKWVNLGRFWGKYKKTKRSADEYFSFQIQECGSTTLETINIGCIL